MRSTVAYPATTKPVDKDDVHTYVNEELHKVLPQLRRAANIQARESDTATTDGAGTFATVWVSPAMPTDATWGIVVDLAGITTSGTAQQARYLFTGTFISVANAVSQLGATTTMATTESAAAIDFQFVVDAVGRTVAVQARDNAASPMKFTAVVQTTEGLPT